MELFLITFILVSIAIAGISIKIWGKKNGKFSGTCASQNPFLKNKNEPCSYCGKLPSEKNCTEKNSQLN
ncbi:MAG: membrane or secreted protein [Flavobacteriaceae bacterium]|nr:membrane or secreted protein [Flavobacteriaceae bacterium]